MKILNNFKTDASLIVNFGEGDASAFEVLYARHKNTLFNYVFRQLPTPSDAEEVAQEIWMAVIRQATHYKHEASFKSWLFSIAFRRCADWWRKQHPEHSDDELDSISSENNTDLEQQRLEQEVTRALKTLPDEQRQTFMLRQEGFSYAEIANMTESSSETVKSRLRYAKNSLQALLGEDHD